MFGRFEAAAPNELWVGDALHGPRVGDRKTYLFAFLDDHTRLVVGYRFGFAEDTVRLAAALKPALAARGVPAGIYVDNGSAFVDAWLLRACAKLGIRLVHSAPGRPQGRGKIERFFRTVREQFLVEVTDTTARRPRRGRGRPPRGIVGTQPAVHGVGRNRIPPPYPFGDRASAAGALGGRLGRPAGSPALPTAADLTEAFLWSEFRVVTKTATVSLHANTYRVDPALAGRRVELVFSPFDLETIEVRYRDQSFGAALAHTITRHAHPKARPETVEAASPVATGIDYLALTAAAHHEQLRRDERIGYHALYALGTEVTTAAPGEGGQGPGQLSLTDLDSDDTNEGEVSA